MQEIRPQPGPQEEFLSSPADIVFYGGAAGGGKTFALLLEPLRHVANDRFRAVIFRRTYPQIESAGGLFESSADVYPKLGARPVNLSWHFPSGMQINFRHLQHEKNKFDWQGAQIPFLGFDEVTQFSESQFFYLMSRNRSTSGVPGYIRATCNPPDEDDHWIFQFVNWFLDCNEHSPTYGMPIKERCGKIRYFARRNDELVWGSSREELYELDFTDNDIKSFTFIPSNVYDNKILLEQDPSYIASLNALPLIDRLRLKDGNWKERPSKGLLFKKPWFEIVDTMPSDIETVRYWDRAGTEGGGDYTVGLKMGRTKYGMYFVEHVERFQHSPLKVEQCIRNTAAQDSVSVSVGIEQDPGQAGKFEADYYVRQLSGFIVKCYPVSSDKITRAKPVSSQAEAGNIKIVRGAWNTNFLNELEAFPEGKNDDQVDSLSGAFVALTRNANLSTPRASTV